MISQYPLLEKLWADPVEILAPNFGFFTPIKETKFYFAKLSKCLTNCEMFSPKGVDHPKGIQEAIAVQTIRAVPTKGKSRAPRTRTTKVGPPLTSSCSPTKTTQTRGL